MLYIGEKVGTGRGPKVDIALDPLEGTNLCANGAPDAIACIAMAPHGCFLNAPDTYMEKIAVGAGRRGVDRAERVAGRGTSPRLAEAKRLADRGPGRADPRPPAPPGADRGGAQGRRAHPADHRRRRRGRHRDLATRDRHRRLHRHRRRARGRARGRGAALHRRRDPGQADVPQRRGAQPRPQDGRHRPRPHLQHRGAGAGRRDVRRHRRHRRHHAARRAASSAAARSPSRS